MQEYNMQPQEENMYLVHYDEALGSFVFENNHMSNTEDEAEADLSDWLWLIYDDHRNNSLLTRTNEDEGYTDDIDDLFAYLAPYEPQIDMPAAEKEHNLEEMSTYARSAENEPALDEPQEHIERMLDQPIDEDQTSQSTQPAMEDQTIQFINPITADQIYEPTFPVVRD